MRPSRHIYQSLFRPPLLLPPLFDPPFELPELLLLPLEAVDAFFELLPDLELEPDELLLPFVFGINF